MEDFAHLTSTYQVANDLIENIRKCGYKEPTPIQMQAIPILLEVRKIFHWILLRFPVIFCDYRMIWFCLVLTDFNSFFIFQGRQLLACAPTGSGKTAAFLVPMIHQLNGPQKKGFRAVIVSPTRELAKQTYRECLRLGEGRGFRVHIISNVNQAMSKYGTKSSQKFGEESTFLESNLIFSRL